MSRRVMVWIGAVVLALVFVAGFAMVRAGAPAVARDSGLRLPMLRSMLRQIPPGSFCPKDRSRQCLDIDLGSGFVQGHNGMTVVTAQLRDGFADDVDFTGQFGAGNVELYVVDSDTIRVRARAVDVTPWETLRRR